MGQTLTHGIYLPDEGERNCYSGLAANWQLLDGAVGTIAEHTSQIAGKAPLVHTHTKADITDFPVYGTTAGTICEGNDSRLSDARTPVAHTHTKSDVTDLLNSNFIPSANNSYDLGSSSYQWNNLYAKNYFYNGVAWGLDKDNTWSAEQTYSKNLVITCTATPGAAPSTDMVSGFRMKNAEKSYSFVEVVGRIGTSGVTYANLVATNKFKNGNIDVGGSSKSANIQVGIRANGDKFIYTDCEFRNSLVPYSLDLGNVHLGTSTNKWKTLNGVNPGALSLPSSSYDPISTQNWIKRPSSSDGGFMCNIVPSVNGWICIQVTREKDFGVWVVGTFRQAFRAVQTSATTYVAMICFPALASSSINIYTNSVETDDADLTFNIARIYPCLGNV